MEEILFKIQNWLGIFPNFGYFIIFLCAFLEALAFVGSIFPGTVIIVMFGFFCYTGQFNIFVSFAMAVLGAGVADILSYYMGRYKGLDLKIGKKKLFRFLYLPEAGDFLLNRGGLSIVIGRFIGPTRAFVPFYMGAAGEKERKFIFYDILGIIIWAMFYLLIGFVFGKSYELLRNMMSVFAIFIVFVIMLTVSPLIFTKIFKKKLQNKSLCEK